MADPIIIRQTQDFWEPRLGHRPTEGEAEMMILNVTNLFKLLLEWDAKESKDTKDPICPSCHLLYDSGNNTQEGGSL
jgi:hypothetical protein